MSRDRQYRGGLDGRRRPFDWLALARQHGISEKDARPLYEQAVRQAGAHPEPRLLEESIYLELLTDARLKAWRPSPGKVTRTMRLQAHRAGKRRGPHVSHLTGQPIAPGKRALTWHLEPAVPARQAEEEPLEANVTSFRGESASVPVDSRDALALTRGLYNQEQPGKAQAIASGAKPRSAQDIMTPGTVAYRQFQGYLASAFGYFEELESLKAEGIDLDPRTVVEGAESKRVRGAAGEYVGEESWVGEQLWTGADASEETDDSAPGPLPGALRTRMERAFGQRFDHVRVYRDTPVPGGGKAVNRGHDIHLGPDAPALESPKGERILAHELAHVAQRDLPAADRPSRRPSIAALEADAHQAAQHALAGRAAAVRLTAPAGLALGYPDEPDDGEFEEENDFDAADPPTEREVAGPVASEPPPPAPGLPPEIVALMEQTVAAAQRERSTRHGSRARREATGERRELEGQLRQQGVLGTRPAEQWVLDRTDDQRSAVRNAFDAMIGTFLQSVWPGALAKWARGSTRGLRRGSEERARLNAWYQAGATQLAELQAKFQVEYAAASASLQALMNESAPFQRAQAELVTTIGLRLDRLGNRAVVAQARLDDMQWRQSARERSAPQQQYWSYWLASRMLAQLGPGNAGPGTQSPGEPAVRSDPLALPPMEDVPAAQHAHTARMHSQWLRTLTGRRYRGNLDRQRAFLEQQRLTLESRRGRAGRGFAAVRDQQENTRRYQREQSVMPTTTAAVGRRLQGLAPSPADGEEALQPLGQDELREIFRIAMDLLEDGPNATLSAGRMRQLLLHWESAFDHDPAQFGWEYGSLGTYHTHGAGQYDVNGPANAEIHAHAPLELDLSALLSGDGLTMPIPGAEEPQVTSGERRVFRWLRSWIYQAFQTDDEQDLYSKLAYGVFGRGPDSDQIAAYLRGERSPTQAAPDALRVLAALLYYNATGRNSNPAGATAPSRPHWQERSNIIALIERELRTQLGAHYAITIPESLAILQRVDASQPSQFGRPNMINPAFVEWLNVNTHRHESRRSVSTEVRQVVSGLMRPDGGSQVRERVLELLKRVFRVLEGRAQGSASGHPHLAVKRGTSVTVRHTYVRDTDGQREEVVFEIGYKHLARVAPGVVPGTEFSASGLLIGFVGSTGNAISPHVHLSIEMFQDGETRGYMNPLDFFGARDVLGPRSGRAGGRRRR